MMKKIGLTVILMILIFFVMCTPPNNSTTNNNATKPDSLPPIPTNLSIKVNPINNLDPDFIKGADISMLAQIEKSGGVFYDTDGSSKDCLVILKNHGVNWVRIRLWNNPVLTQTVIDGEKLTGVSAGDPAGGGNCDLNTVINLAKRAKALGMKFLLDFHYSDFWADPGKQYLPETWAGLSGTDLQQAIYDYTAQVINSLKNNSALPDMVQIGNELNTGMCWPYGKIANNDFTGFVSLLKKAAQAVRENALQAKIMIHLANGGDNGLYHRIFDALQTAGADYDVIGLSYYPYWHGSISQLTNNMNDIAVRYSKQVAVAETAYAFTTAENDSCNNIFTSDYPALGGYEATAQGQATLIHDVMAAVAAVPGNQGLGVFYWEPDWIAVNGAGWVTGQGSGWENQAWWDYTGQPLESIWTYRLVSEATGTYTAQITAIPGISIKTTPGVAPVLPAETNAVYSDGAYRSVTVAWDTIDPSLYAVGGVSFTVEGTVSGTAIKAKADIYVSYIKNPGFESGDKTGWTITGTGVKNELYNSGNIYSGSCSLGYWLNSAFVFTVSQAITGLTPGNYTVSVWSEGGGGENDFHLFADNGTTVKTSVITNTGWAQWKHTIISGITVGGSGTLTIGISCDAPSEVWGYIDDFDLVKE